MSSISIAYAALSDVGLVRSNNQDSGYAGPNLLVVADGMGGAAGGDIASSVAVAHLAPLDGDDHGADDLLDLLTDALEAAHRDLSEYARTQPTLAGLGTTVDAMLISGSTAAMVHIGDSRVYLLREGALQQVTTDHTFVQHLIDTGQLTPEEAESHPQRSVILRVLGDSAATLDLDESVRELRPGERWLFCSDGLSGFVSDDTIEQTLREQPDLAACAEKLIALALRAGGGDNVTVVVADVLAGDAAVPDTPRVVGSAATDRRRPSRGGSGAAARAAALTAAARAEDEDEDAYDGEDVDAPPPRRRWLRRLLTTVVVLALLAGGLTVGYRWTQSQYYVAIDGERVAIFQGVPQDLGPIELSSVYERTGPDVADLPGFARTRVSDGISATDLAQAREIVAELADEAT